MNKKISFPIAIIIIVVCAILVGGIVIWQYLGIPKEEAELPEEKAPEEVVTEDETADWKTYRNEEYGFEIKYPSDWGLREGPFESPPFVAPGMIVITSPKHHIGGFDITITEITEEESLEEYIDSKGLREGFNAGEEKEIKFLELFGIQRKEWNRAGRYVELVTYFKKNNLIFRFSYRPMYDHEVIGDVDKKLNDQILSTFRFLE